MFWKGIEGGIRQRTAMCLAGEHDNAFIDGAVKIPVSAMVANVVPQEDVGLSSIHGGSAAPEHILLCAFEEAAFAGEAPVLAVDVTGWVVIGIMMAVWSCHQRKKAFSWRVDEAVRSAAAVVAICGC